VHRPVLVLWRHPWEVAAWAGVKGARPGVKEVGMAGQLRKTVVLFGLCAFCLWLGEASPCFSQGAEPASVTMVAVGPEKHVVKAGETINGLAQQYGIPAAAILRANPGLTPTRLQLGKTILIPAGGQAPMPSSPSPIDEPALADNPVELRPEKAPQATKPLKERDLVDVPAKKTAAPRPAAAEQHATPPSPEVAKPAAVTSPPATPTASAPETAKPPRVEDVWPQTGQEGVNPGMMLPRLQPLLASLWLLGGLGVAAVLAAVALRGVLANLGAGLALLAFRFPRTREMVRIGDQTGRVISRGLFFLVVRTPESARVIVPNALVLRQGLTVLPARDGDA